ncbi:ATP-binding protein [Roseivirga sp. BDSF3-8]|uniref:HAMP domain-containing sensor histidine kinase n=1 Tax=Roseivirga sp. BDSF3-8 TaxID=3241598 RepID=UPI003531D624
MLFAFLSFTSLIVFIAIVSVWYFRETDQVRQTRNQVGEVYVSTLRLTKADADFLATDITNNQFYQDGTSLLLRHRYDLSDLISDKIDSLSANESSGQFGIRQALGSFDRKRLAYEEKFAQLVKALKNRGFKDYGVEGDMREYAHELERHSPAIPEKDLLMLRRHEKDFLMRGEAEYIFAFNHLADVLLSRMSGNDNKAARALTNYKKAFNTLAKAKREIGLANQGGLIAELSDLGELLDDTFHEIDAKAQLKENEILDTIKSTYMYLVGVCVLLGLLLSHVLSRLITRPIVSLRLAMKEVESRGFTADHLNISASSSSVEIQQLYEAYNEMLKRLHSQLSLIRQSSQTLKDQNNNLKEINNKLHASEFRLKQLNNTKDKFFSIIAHDLKGPMATLSSFLKIFITYEQGFSREEMRGLASRMYDSTTQLSVLLENLLEWSRSQMGAIRYEPVQLVLNDLIHNNIALHRQRAMEKEISLDVSCESGLKVKADTYMLDFIIRNLLSNALKFTPAGGKVMVCASREEDLVHLFVKDTGIGIPYEDQKKLFEESHHLTKKGTANETGTGLGLLLSKEFATYHKATIQVKSKPGYGTTFTLALPVVEEEAVA